MVIKRYSQFEDPETTTQERPYEGTTKVSTTQGKRFLYLNASETEFDEPDDDDYITEGGPVVKGMLTAYEDHSTHTIYPPKALLTNETIEGNREHPHTQHYPGPPTKREAAFQLDQWDRINADDARKDNQIPGQQKLFAHKEYATGGRQVHLLYGTEDAKATNVKMVGLALNDAHAAGVPLKAESQNHSNSLSPYSRSMIEKLGGDTAGIKRNRETFWERPRNLHNILSDEGMVEPDTWRSFGGLKDNVQAHTVSKEELAGAKNTLRGLIKGRKKLGPQFEDQELPSAGTEWKDLGGTYTQMTTKDKPLPPLEDRLNNRRGSTGNVSRATSRATTSRLAWSENNYED